MWEGGCKQRLLLLIGTAVREVDWAIHWAIDWAIDWANAGGTYGGAQCRCIHRSAAASIVLPLLPIGHSAAPTCITVPITSALSPPPPPPSLLALPPRFQPSVNASGNTCVHQQSVPYAAIGFGCCHAPATVRNPAQEYPMRRPYWGRGGGGVENGAGTRTPPPPAPAGGNFWPRGGECQARAAALRLREGLPCPTHACCEG